MATKKPVATNDRKLAKKPAPSKKTTTKVTTLKANQKSQPVVREVEPATVSAVAASPRRSTGFSFSRAPLATSAVAEFIGTFLLAAVVIASSGQPLFVMFAAIAVVLTIGGISGAHLNPALTIGALATKRTSAARAVTFIVAQVLGALLALVLLNAFIGAAPEVSQQAQAYGQAKPTLFKAPELAKGKEMMVVASELLGSVILAFAVAGAARVRRSGSELTHAFTYGAGLYIALLIAGTAANYVGASAILNPAVAASLQALSLNVWPLAAYVVTPLVGGVLGYALNDLLKPNQAGNVTE